MELARKVTWVPAGARSVIIPLTKASNFSRSSGVMMSTWPVKPWRRALYLTRCLASGVAGPLRLKGVGLRSLLLRAVARRWRSETRADISVFSAFELFIFELPYFCGCVVWLWRRLRLVLVVVV